MVLSVSLEYLCKNRVSLDRNNISSPVAVTTFSNASSNTNSLAISTTTPELLFLNPITGSVVRKAPTPSMLTHLQFSHSFLFSGSSDGSIRIHDPRNGMLREDGENRVHAHVSGIQGLQSGGNFIYTIGFGMRWMPLVLSLNCPWRLILPLDSQGHILIHW
jgi:hypothetical protein